MTGNNLISSPSGKCMNITKHKIRVCVEENQRQRESKPACALVLSNRSIRRSALPRSSLRSSSSWLIRTWGERNTRKMCQNNVKLTYIALLCRVTNIEDMMKLNLEDVVKTKKKQYVMKNTKIITTNKSRFYAFVHCWVDVSVSKLKIVKEDSREHPDRSDNFVQ